MKRRRLLLILAATVVVLLVGLGVYWAKQPKPGVTMENFRRLRTGMTLREVKAIFGSEANVDVLNEREEIHTWSGSEDYLFSLILLVDEKNPAGRVISGECWKRGEAEPTAGLAE